MANNKIHPFKSKICQNVDKNSILDNVLGFELDQEQKKAVLSKEKYVLVLAGAGTGKTLTIIGKIRYLIEILKINQNDILCISFTNETVKQLENKLFRSYKYKIKIRTFHKIAYEQLKRNNPKIHISNTFTLNNIVDNYFDKIILNQNKEYSQLIHYISIKKSLAKKSFPTYPQDYYEKEIKKLKNTCIKFIHLIKSNNFPQDKIIKIINRNKFNLNLKQKQIINFQLKIINNIYEIYKEQLVNTNTVDFEDIINESIKYIKDKFKYIIVDEFQDTSYMKYKFLKKLAEIGDSNIITVGDDFQSIYSFNGCNFSTFINFKKIFKNSKIYKITNTFRNSQELIDVAGKFIMKNKYQLKKNLKSKKHLNKPIKIYYYSNIINFPILKILDKMDINQSIFILGRNNNDIKYLENIIELKIQNNKIIYIKKQKLEIRFLTVHSSKGLEADNVIIINMEDKYNGFPNKIREEKIIYDLNQKIKYHYEEERRLFYVALTRSKNNVYIITKKNNESIFVQEIIKNNKNKIEIIK